MAHIRSYDTERPCEYCNKLFFPRKDATKKGLGKFCSIGCANLSRKILLTGDPNEIASLYKQGMTIHEIAIQMNESWRAVRLIIAENGILRHSGQRLTNGYLTTYASDGTRMTIHTLVATEKIGRKPLSNEVVHHLNTQKTDNRPENLVILGRKEHAYQHLLLERLAGILVDKNLIEFQNGYTFSLKMEELLKHV